VKEMSQEFMKEIYAIAANTMLLGGVGVLVADLFAYSHTKRTLQEMEARGQNALSYAQTIENTSVGFPDNIFHFASRKAARDYRSRNKGQK
jgi:hypothetical protein